MNEIGFGMVFEEALYLMTIMRVEEIEDRVEEVLNFDDGLIGERWQIDGDINGTGIGAHCGRFRLND